MAGWDTLAGAGSVAEQLAVWGVLQNLVTTLLGPTLDLVAQQVNSDHPEIPLTPADAANAVVRNFMDAGGGAAEAARGGVNADRFRTMVHLAGDAPAPQELAVALRRSLVPEGGTGAESTSFEQGIAEGRLADKWAPIIKGLATIWPTPTDALDALLQGQVTDAEGRRLYELLGGDPQFFQMLFDTRGSAPTPLEAIQMANRGIIPWDGQGPGVVSYTQAFLEGPWRNKWLGPYRELGRYIPPPRTVTALIHDGAIDDATALEWFRATGMDQATAAAYLKSAHATKTAAARELAMGTVLTLYEGHAMDAQAATAHLAKLGYQPADISLLLEVSDLQREVAALNSQVGRIGTLYMGRKITRRAASDALDALGATHAHRDHLLALWDVERAANVRPLTPAEIVDAWEFSIIDQAEAERELVNLGYTPRDAWLKLSIKAKAAQPNPPAQGPQGPGVNP